MLRVINPFRFFVPFTARLQLPLPSSSYYFARLLPRLEPFLLAPILPRLPFLPGLERNSVIGRATAVQYAANNPIEDRFDYADLEGGAGFIASVFDGHGGSQMAQFASEKLTHYFCAEFQQAQGNKNARIVSSLVKAFDQVEEQYLEWARGELRKGFATQVGTCVLAAVVADNVVIAANAGDCKGLILSRVEGRVCFRKINRKLNATSRKEQARLRKQFPEERDIVVCRGDNPRAWYVKNRLQPTRSLGDYSLKHAEFNREQRQSQFSGPYITHKPEIMQFQLTPDDLFLVLASDGLWDQLSKQQVADIVVNTPERAPEALLAAACARAALNANMSEEQLRKTPLGQRRNYHDDITVVLVDLKGQYR